MAIAIQEVVGIRPESVTVGAQLRVKVQYPGEVRDNTGAKKPGLVEDKFNASITGTTEVDYFGRITRAFILSDSVHELVIPADNIYRGRSGVMTFEHLMPERNNEAPVKPRTEREMREAIGLPGKKPRPAFRR